jgi:hypothetical protein
LNVGCDNAVVDGDYDAATDPRWIHRGGVDMDQAGLVTLIDEALERFAVRDVVSAAEVVDFLLDLRTAVVSDAALAALIEAESQPTH